MIPNPDGSFISFRLHFNGNKWFALELQSRKKRCWGQAKNAQLALISRSRRLHLNRENLGSWCPFPHRKHSFIFCLLLSSHLLKFYVFTYLWNTRNSTRDIRRRKGKLKGGNQGKKNHESRWSLGNNLRASDGSRAGVGEPGGGCQGGHGLQGALGVTHKR